MRKASQKAFTLIELLAVIAIITILFLILFPIIRDVNKRARRTQCHSHLRQWGTYWALYCSDHQGRFMGAFSYDKDYYGDHRGTWVQALTNYYTENSRLLFCPLATAPNVVDGKVTDYGGAFTSYRSGVVRMFWTNASYGLNDWVYDPLKDSGGDVQGGEVEKHWRGISGSGRPHEVPVFFDSMWRGARVDYDDNRRIRAPTYNGEWGSYDHEMMHVSMDRHEGGVEMVFMDMSARHVPIKTLWHLQWHRYYDPTAARNAVGAWPAWMKDYPEPTP